MFSTTVTIAAKHSSLPLNRSHHHLHRSSRSSIIINRFTRASSVVRSKTSSNEEEEEEEEEILPNDENKNKNNRRRALIQTTIGSLLLSLSRTNTRDAFAGQVIDQLERMLMDTNELLMDGETIGTMSDEEREGLERERVFFEKQIQRIEENGEFVKTQRESLMNSSSSSSSTSSQSYTSGIRIAVADVKSEVQFWETAMGMRVTYRDDIRGIVRLAYGRETLNEDDGGKASIEIYPLSFSSTKRNTEKNENNNEDDEYMKLKYIQCTVPFGIRVSRVYEAGGELLYGFGYFDLRSPNGIPVIASVSKRRDSFEAVAIESKNVNASANSLRKASKNSLNIFDAKLKLKQDDDAEVDRKKFPSFVPPPPRGSKFLSALPIKNKDDGLRIDLFPDSITVRVNMTLSEKIAEKAENVRRKLTKSDDDNDGVEEENEESSNANFTFLGFQAVVSNESSSFTNAIPTTTKDSNNDDGEWTYVAETLSEFENHVAEKKL